MMITVVKWAHLLALATWLGGILLLSFVVAPAVFGAFGEAERASAGRVMAAIFPGYYRVGAVCGAALVVTSLLLWRWGVEGSSRWLGGCVTAGVMFALVLYAGLVVQPRAHALRPQLSRPDASPALKAEFDALHRRAVQLNVAVLIGALVLTGVTATKLQP